MQTKKEEADLRFYSDKDLLEMGFVLVEDDWVEDDWQHPDGTEAAQINPKDCLIDITAETVY
jgi:hypothetical protein